MVFYMLLIVTMIWYRHMVTESRIGSNGRVFATSDHLSTRESSFSNLVYSKFTTAFY